MSHLQSPSPKSIRCFQRGSSRVQVVSSESDISQTSSSSCSWSAGGSTVQEVIGQSTWVVHLSKLLGVFRQPSFFGIKTVRHADTTAPITGTDQPSPWTACWVGTCWTNLRVNTFLVTCPSKDSRSVCLCLYQPIKPIYLNYINGQWYNGIIKST